MKILLELTETKISYLIERYFRIFEVCADQGIAAICSRNSVVGQDLFNEAMKRNIQRRSVVSEYDYLWMRSCVESAYQDLYGDRNTSQNKVKFEIQNEHFIKNHPDINASCFLFESTEARGIDLNEIDCHEAMMISIFLCASVIDVVMYSRPFLDYRQDLEISRGRLIDLGNHILSSIAGRDKLSQTNKRIISGYIKFIIDGFYYKYENNLSRTGFETLPEPSKHHLFWLRHSGNSGYDGWIEVLVNSSGYDEHHYQEKPFHVSTSVFSDGRGSRIPVRGYQKEVVQDRLIAYEPILSPFADYVISNEIDKVYDTYDRHRDQRYYD